MGGGPLSDDCLFCRLVRGEIPADVVRRDERFVAFNDIAPKAPVHVLVVPVEHVASIAGVDGLDEATRAAMLTFIAGVADDLDLEGDGYRVTTNHGPDAHQSVDHLHWHVMGGGTLSSSM
jgi:histidine triad (HIT) family protein